MNRDGRGRPGRFNVKNQPKLRLVDVLRRRRTTLGNLLSELGITTYSGLDIWCARLGVVPPTQAEFEVVMPPTRRVNSPHEGVIVLEPPPTIDERSGDRIELDPVVESIVVEPSGSFIEPVKRRRIRKDENQPE